MLSRLLRLGNHGLAQRPVIAKRWSGHNAMEIQPSNIDMKFTHNWLHFYIFISAVPVAVITAIIGIRSNPELSEVPEGYEPLHWEYQKHPISRFMARYFYTSVASDNEVMMNLKQNLAHERVLKRIGHKCEQVMRFYNDHRSMNFLPVYGEYFRAGRDDSLFRLRYQSTQPNTIYDTAYEHGNRTVPTEGYQPNFNPADIK